MAIVDAGLKASSVDSGMPGVWQRPGLAYTHASDEHGWVEGNGRRCRALGEKSAGARATATRRSTCTTGTSACADRYITVVLLLVLAAGCSSKPQDVASAPSIDPTRKMRELDCC